MRDHYAQIEGLQPGLMASVLDTRPDGELVRKSGMIVIVLNGGVVRPGDVIDATPADGPFVRPAPV